jgi:sugar phosphate isomerase/epimerase
MGILAHGVVVTAMGDVLDAHFPVSLITALSDEQGTSIDDDRGQSRGDALLAYCQSTFSPAAALVAEWTAADFGVAVDKNGARVIVPAAYGASGLPGPSAAGEPNALNLFIGDVKLTRRANGGKPRVCPQASRKRRHRVKIDLPKMFSTRCCTHPSLREPAPHKWRPNWPVGFSSPSPRTRPTLRTDRSSHPSQRNPGPTTSKERSMAARLSVQLYSLGAEAVTDTAAMVARLASLGYAAVEPVVSTGSTPALREFGRSMGMKELPPLDVAALRSSLDEHGMVAPSCHVALPEGAMAQAILDEQEDLGSSLLVAPAVFDEKAGKLEAFDDLDSIKRLAERFNVAADLARPRGMRVGYHNHFWELETDFGGRSGLELFYELTAPDVVAEVDMYWAQVAGRDPVDLHVKDGSGSFQDPSLPLGTGVVDLPAVLAAGDCVQWHVVELEGVGDGTWSALEQGARYLVDGGWSIGQKSLAGE